MPPSRGDTRPRVAPSSGAVHTAMASTFGDQLANSGPEPASTGTRSGGSGHSSGQSSPYGPGTSSMKSSDESAAPADEAAGTADTAMRRPEPDHERSSTRWSRNNVSRTLESSAP